MYTGILHTHSGMRYLVLVILLVSTVKSAIAYFTKSDYKRLDDRLAFFGMLFIHLQFLFGLILYFISPKVSFASMAETMQNETLRYYTVEHLLIMLLVIALVTIGRISSKKKQLAIQKHKTIALYYGFSLILILLTVYWMMP